MSENTDTCRMSSRPDWDETLSAWVDGELESGRDAELRDHVAGCAVCRARVEALRRVDLQLAAMPLPAVPDDLRERLARRLETPATSTLPSRRAPPPRRRWLTPAAGLAVAAAAALALYLSVGGGESPLAPPTPQQPVAQTSPEAPLQIAPEAAGAVPSDAELAVAFELETAEDLPVIANLEVLERLLALEEGRG